MSIPLRESYSLVFFAAWFVLGSAVMAFFRFVMDRIIIPQEKLDEEIANMHQVELDCGNQIIRKIE